MKNLPNGIKWLILVLIDRASRVEMPPPDNLFGIYENAAGEE